MKQLTTRLIDLGKSLGSTTQEFGADSLVELPHTLQSTLVLPFSHRRAFSDAAGANILQNDSFSWRSNQSVAGVGGGAVITGPLLSAGVWRFDGFLHGAFTGTTNVANNTSVFLQNLANGDQLRLAVHAYVTGSECNLRFEKTLTILDNPGPGAGWNMIFATSATIAGDQLAAYMGLTASRLF